MGATFLFLGEPETGDLALVQGELEVRSHIAQELQTASQVLRRPTIRQRSLFDQLDDGSAGVLPRFLVDRAVEDRFRLVGAIDQGLLVSHRAAPSRPAQSPRAVCSGAA